MAIQALSRHGGTPGNPAVGVISVDVGDVFLNPDNGALYTVTAATPGALGQQDTVNIGSGPVAATILAPFYRTSYRGSGHSDPSWPTQP